VTQWGYDANGNLLSLLDGDNYDANGDATVYTYDARNLKTSEAFPGHGPTSSIGDADYDLVGFTYDAARRIAVKTDQQGDTATHNYDLAGRLTSRDYLGGAVSPLADQSDTDTFTYDSAGRMTSATSGRYNNVVAMGYDNASRLVSESLTAYGQTYMVGSGFDAANRKTSITYPDGKVVSRGYTARDLLSQITYDGSVVDTRTYDNGGRLSTSLYGNGIGTTWNYRNDNLVSSITRTNLTGADFNYTYDANKNKTSETISGVMAPYGFDSTGYDNQDRLTAWNRTDGALNQSWNLSKEGDWNSFTENTVTENRSHNNVHELTSIDITPLLYDAKGNLTQNSNGQTYTWDFDNYVEQAIVDSTQSGVTGTHTYAYDAFGRRVSKSVQNVGDFVTTVYVLTEVPAGDRTVGQVLAEYSVTSSTPQLLKKYIYESYVDEPCLLVETTDSGEFLYWYYANALASIAGVTDENAAVVDRYAYDIYGRVLFVEENGSMRASPSSRFGDVYAHSGRQFDHETALFYYRARAYDARLGRFISRDPIGYTDGPNLYRAYFIPNSVDPTGLGPVSVRYVYEDDGTSVSSVVNNPDGWVIGTGDFQQWAIFHSIHMGRRKMRYLESAHWKVVIPFHCNCSNPAAPVLEFDFNTFTQITTTTPPNGGGGGISIPIGGVGVSGGIYGSHQVYVGLEDARIVGNKPCANFSAKFKAYWVKAWSGAVSVSFQGMSIKVAGGGVTDPWVLAEQESDRFTVKCCCCPTKLTISP
jgi:RHS repeat-associated protein